MLLFAFTHGLPWPVCISSFNIRVFLILRPCVIKCSNLFSFYLILLFCWKELVIYMSIVVIASLFCDFLFFFLRMVTVNMQLIFTLIKEIRQATKRWSIKMVMVDMSPKHSRYHSPVKYQTLTLIDPEPYCCRLIFLEK